MKRSMIALLILIIAIAMMGCTKKTTNDGINSNLGDTQITIPPSSDAMVTPQLTSSAAQENHEGEMKSFLTGLWVPVEIGNRRPIAFQFNNFKVVSNQSGISQADIVYECMVEGGITRLLGIGENYTGDRIGSTRSARHYFVSIADEYDAIYIHFGKTKYATSKMNKLGIDHLDGSGSGGAIFYRDKNIKAPHNAFASAESIWKAIDKAGFEKQHADGYESHFTFYEQDTDLVNGNVANKVALKYSGYTAPYFEYNDKDKLYYRFQFGGPHKDTVTDAQLSFKNVIVQFVKEWNIDKNGYQTMDLEDATGRGYYITNGKVNLITWKKDESLRWMRYYNEAGEELTINPGKTFIEVFPQDRLDDVTVK